MVFQNATMAGEAALATQLAVWFPDAATIMKDLTFVPDPLFDHKKMMEPWLGEYPLHYFGDREFSFFNGYVVSRWTAQHWQIPLAAVSLYLTMIPTLRRTVADKPKSSVLKPFAIVWNIFLSTFSFCGLAACLPVMLGELSQNGLYFTVCAPAPWYGGGVQGLFVALFIYSKLAELVDTVLLLLNKRPVILLHWWHHVTVLLYCWHSYAAQIATGLWFATMNYAVHSVMYAYFAATQTSLRKAVKPFAIYITLAQLTQMLVGIFVTARAVFYQLDGKECHVNKTNSVLGLTMYASYFLLFAKLFVENYIFKKGSNKDNNKPSSSSSSRTASFKAKKTA